ncbi:MAG: nucleotide exchange factor GrpE [Clostridia bacterium]|nr:nucleotide exchange factor GrpE [Clostridia bacterium]
MDKKEKQEQNTAEEKAEIKEELTAEEVLQAEIDRLKKELEKRDADAKEQTDKYLRLAAEYDNFRRRSREEKDALYDSAVSDTVAELLPIIDNLERATAFENGDKVKEGLQMVVNTVAATLGKIKVEEFGKTGDTFDPQLHNAVMHVEDDEHGEGEILEVFQKGYKKGNKIIRFAMVKTAN